jgi:hypothetical protein
VRGHFTAAPLAGLWAGAVQPQGDATARTLKRYLEANVEQIAKGCRSRPATADPTRCGRRRSGCHDIRQRVARGHVEIAFRAGRTGMIELIGPTADILKADDATTGPWRLRLDKGLHLLYAVATNEQCSLSFVPTVEVTHVEF